MPVRVNMNVKVMKRPLAARQNLDAMWVSRDRHLVKAGTGATHPMCSKI